MTDVPVLNALIFAVLGIGLFVVAFGALVKVAPFQLWKEIVEERNLAVAILWQASWHWVSAGSSPPPCIGQNAGISLLDRDRHGVGSCAVQRNRDRHGVANGCAIRNLHIDLKQAHSARS